MEEVSKNRLWQAILPTMKIWILAPQIKTLENFLLQFKMLTQLQTIIVIWQIAQPAGIISLCNEVLEIQTVHRYIFETPQLVIIQTALQKQEILCMNRYTNIKTDIENLFHNDTSIIICNIYNIMLNLIQMSSIEIIEEIVYHYNFVLNNLSLRLVDMRRNYRTLRVKTSDMSAIEESRNNWILYMRNVATSNLFIQKAIILHEELEKQIIARRQNDINNLVTDIELQLKYMRK